MKTKKSTPTPGAITRSEHNEERKKAKELARRIRKTERLVCISEHPKTWIGIKEGANAAQRIRRFKRSKPLQHD
jgi:hypothetical protein